MTATRQTAMFVSKSEMEFIQIAMQLSSSDLVGCAQKVCNNSADRLKETKTKNCVTGGIGEKKKDIRG